MDFGLWQKACDLGINQAVSFLVVAAGTGGDQRTSSWSATAVEKYTGMHHRRATDAIVSLEANGLLNVEKRGKLRRYTIAQPEECERRWIWLPLTLITGAANENPPVKMLRQAQDVAALKLFIELYYYHDLPGSGGVEWRLGKGIRKLFDRSEVAQYGNYKVWGFRQGQEQTFKSAPFWFEGEFWKRWMFLMEMGLVDFVCHLVESDTAEAEIIHPLPWGNGEKGELAISIAALEAGRRMAPYITDRRMMLVPVSKLRPHVQLIGVARLKYRPQTDRTAQWLTNAPEWEKTAMAFEEMARRAEASGIKDKSR